MKKKHEALTVSERLRLLWIILLLLLACLMGAYLGITYKD